MSGDKRLIVEVWGGPLAFRRSVVAPGAVLRVGRTSLADLVVPHDDLLSQIHFEVRWDGARCEVRDAGSAMGTLVDGQRVERVEACSGAWIRAGGTDFLVHFEQVESSGEGVTESSAEGRGPRAALAEIARRGRLFAVLDAARSERIVPMLQTSVDEYTSLYEGVKAVTMAEAAPYLVRLERDSRLLGQLLSAGWGDHWGIFVESTASLRELKDHFRRLLFVTRENDGALMFFRFYDPRVLRDFLPLCTRRQRAVIFGPVDQFLTEANELSDVLGFARGLTEASC